MPAIPTYYAVKVDGVPLPAPYLDALRRIEVETSTEEAGAFRLHFDLSQTATGDWDVLQLDLFRPQALVRISVNLGKLPEAVINGYVRETRLDNQSEPGRSTLEVMGLDVTSALMDLGPETRSWPNMSDSVIAGQIFARHALIPLVEPTPSSRTVQQVTTIQRTSDMRFLKSLARRNSYECYVQPDPFLGKDAGHFHPPKLSFPPQGVLSVNFGAATNMEGFHVRYDQLQARSALSSFLDPATKTIQPAPVTAATERPMGRAPVLTRIRTAPVARLTDTDSASVGELAARSRSVVNESSRAIRGSGQVDGLRFGRLLRPGLPVLVRGAGRDHSGLYYVTEVRHDISRDGHSQGFDAWRNAVGLTGTEVFLDVAAALP